MKTLIVIPTYNEAQNLEKLVKHIRALHPSYSILIVDDNSPDQTCEVAEKLVKLHPERIKMIERSAKLGRGSAVISGFLYGLQRGFTKFVEMDADFSHDPHELSQLIAHASDHALAIASRYVAGSKIVNWPLSRRVFSKLANWYTTLILGVSLHDHTNGYRAYSRKVLEKLELQTLRETGYAVLMEIAFRARRQNITLIELPTVFINRKRGKSNTNIQEIVKSLGAPLRIRFGKFAHVLYTNK
ncbi:polyprenol monophosphomannose synthase [Candidatus Microgenomates bacterium]|nr:MAG: polyprenol monophosphomannose synthase [Candidatus Microgenomates bacterium]